MAHEMTVIAHIRSDFPTKFGVPRQSGLVEELRSTIVFEPEFRRAEALRGIEAFSHLWLIWQFSEATREGWSATVRPPRLGGNARLGVFATRSPFRPNPIGLSCVRLESVRLDPKDGIVLVVGGADLMDGTPIYDIKPYIPYADAHPEAIGGFAQEAPPRLNVVLPPELAQALPPQQRSALCGVLAQDPRPHYQSDPARVYGMEFSGHNIRFTVSGDTLTVQEIQPLERNRK